MVAYSFKKQFAPKILDGSKRQTIRGHRKRHARPGERLQLFTGMRTKHCKKILEPDPVCVEVRDISFLVLESGMMIRNPRNPGICGAVLGSALAQQDGFENAEAMWRFWLKNHGPGQFDGVLIRWEPQG